MPRAAFPASLPLVLAIALGLSTATGCTDGRNLRRYGSSCFGNDGCASGVCYQGVCSKPCVSDDECEGGTCVRGPNVCAPPGTDAGLVDNDGLGVDATSVDDTQQAPGACVADADCLGNETCAAGQCLVVDGIGCKGKADGTSCANYIVAVSCSGGSPGCGTSWTVAKYGGTPTCQGGVCTPQAGVPGWTGQSTCGKDAVCVPSTVGGVQPCQKRERVPQCVSAP